MLFGYKMPRILPIVFGNLLNKCCCRRGDLIQTFLFGSRLAALAENGSFVRLLLVSSNKLEQVNKSVNKSVDGS